MSFTLPTHGECDHHSTRLLLVCLLGILLPAQQTNAFVFPAQAPARARLPTTDRIVPQHQLHSCSDLRRGGVVMSLSFDTIRESLRGGIQLAAASGSLFVVGGILANAGKTRGTKEGFDFVSLQRCVAIL